MSGSQRGIVGIALLVAVALVVGLYQFAGGGSDDNGGDDDLLLVRGTIGSEKVAFLDNAEVREIFADRYGLRVDFASAGSIEQVEADPGNQDFLWPGSQVALEIYEQRHGAAPASATIFNSPIVLYSWAPV